MDVSMSISTDYAKERFGVALDEKDLGRLVAKYHLPPDIDEDHAYALLTNECERFVLVQSPKYGRQVDAVREQLMQNRETLTSILSSITGKDAKEFRQVVGLE